MSAKVAVFGDDPTSPGGCGKIVKDLIATVHRIACHPVIVGLKKNYASPLPDATRFSSRWRLTLIFPGFICAYGAAFESS